MTPRFLLFLALYALALRAGVVRYSCETHPPDAHCVERLPGRLKAYDVRLTAFFAHSDEIKSVEFFDEAEFPTRNAEICKLQ